MTALTFPSNPTTGQQYDAPNGVQYVFDGVKWIVETITNTSSTVTSTIQDRVAPMIVAGTHSGINVTYNDQTNRLNLTVDIDGGNATTQF